MKIHVGSINPVKLTAVRNVFERVFPNSLLKLIAVEVVSGVPAQPFDADVAKGALTRASSARRDNSDFAVGIEAGLVWQPAINNYFDVQYCAIMDRDGKITLGHGSGFLYPPEILRQVIAGKTVGQAMTRLTGIEQIGNLMGAIGFLSREILNRTALTEQAVLMALIPLIRAELYDESNKS